METTTDAGPFTRRVSLDPIDDEIWHQAKERHPYWLGEAMGVFMVFGPGTQRRVGDRRQGEVLTAMLNRAFMEGNLSEPWCNAREPVADGPCACAACAARERQKAKTATEARP